MADNDGRKRLLIWISACVLIIIIIKIGFYCLYLYYEKHRILNTQASFPHRNDPEQAQYRSFHYQDNFRLPYRRGQETFELTSMHESSQRKSGSETASKPNIVPARAALRKNRIGDNPDRLPINTLPALGKASPAQSEYPAEMLRATGPVTYGKRHDWDSGSDSSADPQMTPETGSSGQQTPLPRYTPELRGMGPPIYAESEPGGHAVRAPLRRPTL